MYKKNVKFSALGAVVLLFCTTALADPQPAMDMALKHLRIAEKALVNAAGGKGGNRMAALEHIRAAIRDVKQGKQFANKR